MTLLKAEEVLRLMDELVISEKQKTELCLSHETLRLLVKNLLSELMANEAAENKDLIQRAQEAVGQS